MSKKYSHSCSSCTNVNNLSRKHIIEYWVFYTTFRQDIPIHIFDAIQDRYLNLYSSIKYCPNAYNPLKKWLLLKMYGWLSSIHKPAFISALFRYFHHVIWVENQQNQIYFFTGHPVGYWTFLEENPDIFKKLL